MTSIRSLVTPGGFFNGVGNYVAALDIGLDAIRQAARASERPADAVRVLRAIGDLESTWIHQAVGAAPTPVPPGSADDVEAWLGWLEAVRTVSLMVLRPLEDRELERLVVVPEGGEHGPRTLKRLLAELLFRHGSLHGQL